jgi:hypothetical protein
MQFTLRDFGWLVFCLSLIYGQASVDRRSMRVAESVETSVNAARRLAHRIDADVHDHLQELSDRLNKVEAAQLGPPKAAATAEATE